MCLIERWMFFVVNGWFSHVNNTYQKWMPTSYIKLYSLMVKTLDCCAKGPWFKFLIRDLTKCYFRRKLLFFLSFSMYNLTFNTKNLHLSNKFWLYQLRVRYKHTVWEASLGAKKVSQVGTITVIKFMQNLNEICKNWNFLKGYSREISIFVFHLYKNVGKSK